MGKSTTEDADRLGENTRRVFEKRASGKRLSGEDLREMGENLVGFFRVLGEWERAEVARGGSPEPPGGNDPGLPVAGTSRPG
jgi:hypothetical protein